MTRVVKVDNSIKKRLARKEQFRKIESRQERIYFLIICEGEQTEPNYFNGLKKDLPKDTLVIADMTITGTGKNTESLVDVTLKFRKKSNQKFDRTWPYLTGIASQKNSLIML